MQRSEFAHAVRLAFTPEEAAAGFAEFLVSGDNAWSEGDAGGECVVDLLVARVTGGTAGDITYVELAGKEGGQASVSKIETLPRSLLSRRGC